MSVYLGITIFTVSVCIGLLFKLHNVLTKDLAALSKTNRNITNSLSSIRINLVETSAQLRDIVQDLTKIYGAEVHPDADDDDDHDDDGDVAGAVAEYLAGSRFLQGTVTNTVQFADPPPMKHQHAVTKEMIQWFGPGVMQPLCSKLDCSESPTHYLYVEVILDGTDEPDWQITVGYGFCLKHVHEMDENLVGSILHPFMQERGVTMLPRDAVSVKVGTIGDERWQKWLDSYAANSCYGRA